MPRVLHSEYDYVDHSIEQEVLDAAGIDLAVGQCKTDDDLIAAAHDCDAIICQYAHVQRARRRGAAALRARQPAGRRLRHRRHGRLREARHLGRQFARLRRGRGGDACAGAGVGADAQYRRLPPRHRARQLAFPVLGQALPRQRHDAGHHRAGPHRQADGAHQPQRLPQRRSPATPTSSTATSQRTSRARRTPRCSSRATSCRCTCRSTRKRGDDQRRAPRPCAARAPSSSTRRAAPSSTSTRRTRRSSAAAWAGWRWMCCRSSRCPPIPSSPRIHASSSRRTRRSISVQAERELRVKAARNVVTWVRTGRPDYPVVVGTRSARRNLKRHAAVGVFAVR